MPMAMAAMGASKPSAGATLPPMRGADARRGWLGLSLGLGLLAPLSAQTGDGMPTPIPLPGSPPVTRGAASVPTPVLRPASTVPSASAPSVRTMPSAPVGSAAAPLPETPASVPMLGVAATTPVAAPAQPAPPPAAPDLRHRSISPGLWTQYTFSDNIDLRPRGQETRGWLLEVTPFIQADINTGRAAGSLYYAARGLVYGGDTVRSSEFRNDLRARADVPLTEQSLRLFAQAYVFDLNRNPFSGGALDPATGATTRTTYTQLDLSPYVVGRTASTEYVLRYRASWVDPGSGFVSNLGQGVSYAAASTFGRQGLGWMSSGDASRYDYSNDFSYSTRYVDALATWSPTAALRLGAGVNYSSNSILLNDAGKSEGWGPSLALDWRPDSRNQVAARWASTYYSNRSALAAAHQSGPVRMGLSYQRDIRDGNQSGLLYFDPTRVFATPGSTGPGGTDPSATGSTPTSTVGLAGDPSLSVGAPLTSGWTQSPVVEARSLVASVQYVGTRSAALLTAFQSSQEPALRVQGFQNAFDIDTWGLQGRYDYRLDARTTAIVTAAYLNSKSNDTGNHSELTGASVGLRYQLTRQAAVLGSLRTAHQRALAGQATSYDEHAASVAGEIRF